MNPLRSAIAYRLRTSRKPRVLHLTTYPTLTPKDGGQIRVSAEVSALRAAGAEVFVLPVLADSWPLIERDPMAICVPSSRLSDLGIPWPCFDIAIGRMASEDRQYADEFRSRFRRARPDVIVLDHPWLLPVAEKFGETVPLVYSAHNVEFRLKARNLEIIGESNAVIESWSEEVRDLELRTLARASAVVAVSQGDADWIRQSFDGRVAIAANGTARREVTSSTRAAWNRRFGGRRFGVFVASGHPPNAIGFWDMLGPSLGFLGPAEFLLVAGSAGSQIESHETFRRHRAVNNARCVRTGFLSNADLDAVVAESACIVLPITLGEGSNLKTADALVSGKPIIATSRAFRGFEQLMAEDGVVIVDSADEFRSEVKRAIGDSHRSFTRPNADQLLWTSTMVPFAESVLKVAS